MNQNEKSYIIIGENKLEMESYVASGEINIYGNHNNRTGLNFNCSKDEQTLYTNKLSLCVHAEVMKQPLPATIEVIEANGPSLKIVQGGEESTYHSLLLFGKVAGKDTETLISYNCLPEKKIIFSSNLKTMVDHQFIKDMTGHEIEKLIDYLITKRLEENNDSSLCH